MSHARTPDPGDGIEDYPEYGLEFAFDDAEDPETVTLFPRSESCGVLAQWISADADAAVDLEGCR